MSSLSTKMDLIVPVGSDQFKVSDYVGNWGKVDAAPGAFICTSTTRPSWGAPKAGRLIYETDTALEWMWNGTAWVRTTASGLLTCSNGSKAFVNRNSALLWNAPAMILAIAVVNVVVPAGNRPLRIRAKWPRGYIGDTTNQIKASIAQSNTLGTGPWLGSWVMVDQQGATSVNAQRRSIGGSYHVDIPAGLAPGLYNFSLQLGPSVNNTSALGIDYTNAGGWNGSLSVVEL